MVRSKSMFSEHPAQILALIRSGFPIEIGAPRHSVIKENRLALSATPIILGFAAIYLIWGSTYLGIRYAVETIPPLLMMSIRHLTAGVLVYVWARTRGAQKPTLKEWSHAAIAGGLLFLGSHGTLAWAEMQVPSGLAALLCATLPLWTVLIARADGTERSLNAKAIAGILLGFGGVALLIGPDLLGEKLNWLAAATVLFGSLSWAMGTAYTRKASLPSSKVLSAAMQMISGGTLLLIAGGISGERVHWSDITLRSTLALAYLIVFGSIVAFTVYTWLVAVSSPSMLSTYAYVNPVVAVFLGWMLAGETLSLRVVAATGVILAGVALVSRRQKAARKIEPRFEPEVCEVAAD